jgi:hypothetical protein
VKPQATILDVIGQPMFRDRWFRDPASWSAWCAFLAALFALPMSREQLEIFKGCTERSTPPSQPCREAWLVCGRRSGKSFTMALTAVYLSVFRDWRPFLAPGELAVVMLVAADRAQAGEILRYIRAFFDVPMLARLLRSETTEAIELTNRVRLQVNSASSTRTRGYAIAVAILDELAFWPTDAGSANPDRDIISAIRPGQAQIREHGMLLCASSPYARRGVLYEAYQRHFGVSDDPILVWRAPTRTMNPTIPQEEVDRAYERDPADAAAEFDAQFRSDVASFVAIEMVKQCTHPVRERLPQRNFVYTAFVDPSGGSSDSMTLAIAHMEGKTAILDAVREVRAPFSPGAAVEQFTTLLAKYQIWTVHGDRYAGEWPREQFSQRGVGYEPCEMAKSELYLAFLPLLNSWSVSLIDHPRLEHQLISLERKVTRGGRDIVDHPRGAHDDIANCVAGACVLAQTAGQIPFNRLPESSGYEYNPLAEPEEKLRAERRAEERWKSGYWSGPGWAPTWHDTVG